MWLLAKSWSSHGCSYIFWLCLVCFGAKDLSYSAYVCAFGYATALKWPKIGEKPWPRLYFFILVWLGLVVVYFKWLFLGHHWIPQLEYMIFNTRHVTWGYKFIKTRVWATSFGFGLILLGFVWFDWLLWVIEPYIGKWWDLLLIGFNLSFFPLVFWGSQDVYMHIQYVTMAQNLAPIIVLAVTLVLLRINLLFMWFKILVWGHIRILKSWIYPFNTKHVPIDQKLPKMVLAIFWF